MFCPVVGPRAICNLEKHSGNACQTKQHGGPLYAEQDSGLGPQKTAL